MCVCIFIYTCECNKFLFLTLFLNSSFYYILFPVSMYIRCKYPIKYIYKKRYGLYVCIVLILYKLIYILCTECNNKASFVCFLGVFLLLLFV